MNPLKTDNATLRQSKQNTPKTANILLSSHPEIDGRTNTFFTHFRQHCWTLMNMAVASEVLKLCSHESKWSNGAWGPECVEMWFSFKDIVQGAVCSWPGTGVVRPGTGVTRNGIDREQEWSGTRVTGNESDRKWEWSGTRVIRNEVN